VWLAESVFWAREPVWRAFGVRSAEEAEIQSGVFYNIGFYNLFVGLGALVGATMLAGSGAAVLLAYAAAFMVGAGVVLLSRNSELWRGALAQIVPGSVVLLALVLR
jgi:putative membrane protein